MSTEDWSEGADDVVRDIEPNESATEAVLAAVAAVEGEELHRRGPPLYWSIDPDALDAFFRGRGDDHPIRGHVRFTYAGYVVTVYADEVVVAEETAVPFGADVPSDASGSPVEQE